MASRRWGSAPQAVAARQRSAVVNFIVADITFKLEDVVYPEPRDRKLEIGSGQTSILVPVGKPWGQQHIFNA